ncbi:MAG: hypothetical protein E7079_06565 [Bacteroidales bacterium]|nr:hypothetical protein [Bacteroidales bacterium]
MKKFLFPAFALGLLMTSCQSDEPMMNGLGEEQQVSFTVSLPDVASTRAAGGTNSALGGVSNNVGENVTFNVALYLDGRLVYADNEIVPSTGNHTSATFEPTLVIGENYQLVAFAEFDGDATATGEGVNPATNMGLIAIESGINNEKNDEYFVTTTVTAAPKLSAELKRPYGKLRLIAEDLAEAERQFGDKVESVEVTYKHTRPTNFNVIVGTFDPAFTAAEQTFEALYGVYGADTDASRTIFVDYIPGKFDGSDVMMPFTIEVKFANGKTYTRSFTQDIPVRRNWLTTLKGRLFTMDSELTLTIEENFDGEINKEIGQWDGNVSNDVQQDANGNYLITSGNDLAWVAAQVNAGTETFAKKTLILTEDINLNNVAWTPIGVEANTNKSFQGTFDGQNHTISNLNVDVAGRPAGLFGHVIGHGVKPVIKNVKIDGAKVSGAASVGTVVGSLNCATIENCYVNNAEVVAIPKTRAIYEDDGNNAGGLVGYAIGEGATSYVVNNKVENSTITAYRDLGGVIGTAGTNVEIENNVVYGVRVIVNRDGIDAEGTPKAENAGMIVGRNLTGKEIDGNNETVLPVATADELKEALENGEDVVLVENIAIAKEDAGTNGYGATGINVLNGQTIDGGGNDISVDAWRTWDSAINTTGGLIKNINVTGGMRGIFVNHNSTFADKVVLDNVTIDGTIYTISCDQASKKGLDAYNSTFNGWTSYAATIGDVKFTNCFFGEGQGYAYCRPYAPTKFVGCEFEAGFVIDARAKVIFENCTLGGVALTADNLSTLVTSNIANATVK